jgi:hypothetical protein
VLERLLSHRQLLLLVEPHRRVGVHGASLEHVAMQLVHMLLLRQVGVAGMPCQLGVLTHLELGVLAVLKLLLLLVRQHELVGR